MNSAALSLVFQSFEFKFQRSFSSAKLTSSFLASAIRGFISECMLTQLLNSDIVQLRSLHTADFIPLFLPTARTISFLLYLSDNFSFLSSLMSLFSSITIKKSSATEKMEKQKKKPVAEDSKINLYAYFYRCLRLAFILHKLILLSLQVAASCIQVVSQPFCHSPQELHDFPLFLQIIAIAISIIAFTKLRMSSFIASP